MRKRDKLYTANRWNRPLFADVDRENQNIFDGEYNSSMQIGIPINTGYNPQVNIPDKININGIIQQNAYNDYMNSSGNNWFNISKKNNPFSKQNVGTTMKGIGAGAAVAAGAVNTGDPRGLYDTLDPVYHLAGGRESGAGNAMSDAGVGLFNAGAQSGNGWLMLAGAGAKILGGLTNAAFGLKTDKNRLNRINQNIADFNSSFGASSLDDIRGFGALANPEGIYKGGWFSGGKAKKKNEQTINSFNNALSFAQRGQTNTVDNMWREKLHDEFADWYAFGGPLGGPVYGNTGMGAIDYGFMSDYLTAKNRQAENKNTASNPFAGVANNFFSDGGGIHIKKSHEGLFTEKANRAGMGVQEYASHVLVNKENYPTSTVRQANFARNAKKFKHAYGGFLDDPKNIFDFGGDVQTNGADFSTGLTHISAGQSHEENPYDGVQLGVDSEGKPNLVEENETVYNDYVYSNRIIADAETLKKFHLPKKAQLTYADITKRLEKEIKERPNDPISEASFKAQMESLAEQQERQKQEMEAARAREAFEALSPEEQAGVMRYAQQQEQAAQEQAMQQEAMAQQAQMQQPSPEEIAMAEQQQMGQPEVVEEQPVMAYGGKVNRFDGGGVLQLLNKLGYKTVAEAEKAGWKPSDFGDFTDWKQINSNTKLSDDFEWNDEFSKRITSPELKAALSLGWNPTASLVGRKWYEGDNGNSVGWTQSYGKDAINAEEFKDYAQRYKNTLGWAVDNGIIKAPEGNGTISMADITEAMRQSPDWKKTDEWLYSDPANMASYLGMARGLNPDDDTKFINKWSPYGSFTKGDDGQWTYNLKSDLSDADRQAFIDLFRKARTDNKVGVMYNNFSDPTSATNKYVLDEDGNPVLLTTDNLSGYEQLGTYSWGDEPNNINNNAIIYKEKTPAVSSTTAAKPSNAADEWEVTPNYKNDKLRYAGLFGPAVGLGMQLMGIGKPNTGAFDNILEGYDRTGAALADYQPIGNYLRYNPMDIWFEQNRLNANARATDRAILNSGSNQGAKAAALLANGYNTQTASGDLYRKGLEYNDALRQQVAGFNRGTDQFNAEAYNRTALQNAETLNRQRQYRAQLGMQAAAQKADLDAGWYNGIYGNVAGLFKGIGDLGRENAQHNMIAEMAADGIFGSMSPRTNTGRRGKYLTFTKKAACGGKLNKKKGGK